jgi:hypothetical protein
MTGSALGYQLRRNEFRRDVRATRPCVFPVRCVHIDHANVSDAVGRRPSALLEDTLCSRRGGAGRCSSSRFQQGTLPQGAGHMSGSSPQSTRPTQWTRVTATHRGDPSPDSFSAPHWPPLPSSSRTSASKLRSDGVQ